jgi:regulator of sigma E protease
MMIEWLASALPLADSDANALTTFLSQVFLWSKVAIGIGLVIFVHELGHFLAAKTFGVKCEKFYVGFDVPIRIGPIKFPRTLGKFQYGETEYGIGILPLGGYVKMLGQDDDPRKAKEEADRIRLSDDDEEDEEAEQLDPRSYPAKKVWQRMIIISAGVVMNIISGVLFAAYAFWHGVAYNPAIIGGVTPGGPAWQAGIEPGGQVMSVGGLEDDQMHFREMRLAILTAGIDDPDAPIDLKIRYDDGDRDYKLVTAPHAIDEDMRMIGITSPTSTTLSKTMYAAPFSVASEVLTDADAGAKIVGFNGQDIDFSSIVPGTPLFKFLFSSPRETVTLELERADKAKTKVTVELPPQLSKTLGIRYAIGPVLGLVTDGPAEKAGMKVGDVITAVDGDDAIDAYSLAEALVTNTDSVRLTLRRGEGDDGETVEIMLSPDNTPQTLPPASGMSGEVAINQLGFAYKPLPEIKEIVGLGESEAAEATPKSELKQLRAGDVLKEVILPWTDEDVPAELKNDQLATILQTLRDGWEFTSATPLTAFDDAIQLLPEGTKLKVLAVRPPEGKIVETTLVVSKDDRVRFERGLGFTASEKIQTATSLGQAMALGIREGERRLGDVFRFLGMAIRGRVKGKQVGGPIRIVQIAGMEAERGISPQLLFLTMLSMNLAILNFLPIPALDGGHMMFLIAEAIRGKRVDEQLEMRLTLAGVLALLALMIVVFFNDIVNS